jgi:hypothetical protein
MPAGEFVIGRSTECHLAIDDASVSRRHARIRIDPSGVTVADLGSRNGVHVNGLRIEGEHRLHHFDRIGIGNQEMIFVDADQGGQRHAQTTEMRRCEGCGALNLANVELCEGCGAALPTNPGGIEKQTLDLRFGGADELGKSEEAFRLIAGIAEKAIAMKSFEKAEQMLAPHLDLMLFRAHHGELYGPELFDRAVSFALKLAEERSSRRWLHFVFFLHTQTKKLMDAPTIERLHEIVRRTRYTDSRPIADYLAMLAAMEERLRPADRFLVKRLEALHRVITA